MKKIKIIKAEKKKYVLSNEKDYEILERIKQLEKKGLSEKDKELVKFIRTQLEKDWRKPLFEKLKEIEKKH